MVKSDKKSSNIHIMASILDAINKKSHLKIAAVSKAQTKYICWKKYIALFILRPINDKSIQKYLKSIFWPPSWTPS